MLIDNKRHGSLQNILTEQASDAAILSVLTSSFSIYAFEELRDTLAALRAAKLLLPASQAKSQAFQIPELSQAPEDRPFRNRLDGPALANECARWLEQAAEIRASARHTGHNLFHLQNGDGHDFAVHGSSALTSVGIGRVLVLAPGRLRENRTLYTIKDTRNTPAGGRFNFGHFSPTCH